MRSVIFTTMCGTDTIKDFDKLGFFFFFLEKLVFLKEAEHTFFYPEVHLNMIFIEFSENIGLSEDAGFKSSDVCHLSL